MNNATIDRTVWSVGRGQHVQVVKPGLRRRAVEAAVVSGTLVAVDDLAASEFELVIALPDAPDRPITVSSKTARSMTLGSEGEFHQRGRPPSLWLTVRAALDLPELRALTRHGEVVVTADLNLNPA